MKTQYILPFAVFGLLLVALFALSSCDGDDGFDASRFGGPYALALTLEDTIVKKLDFECYQELGLSLSEAVKLDDKKLKQSIEENYKFPDRTDSQKYDSQKYNFVIDVDGEIIVAQWKNTSLDPDKKVNKKCEDRQCKEKSRRDFDLEEDLEGIMVNWFPEDDEAAFKKSPCWLDRDKKKDERPGLLDAISKHLMLAQGEGKTISQFEWKDWMVADVAYAGEIVVDVGNCAYSVNGESGTYQPDRGKMRARAQQYFAKQVSITEIIADVFPEACQ